MKKLLSVVSLAGVLLLPGCNNKNNPDDSFDPEKSDLIEISFEVDKETYLLTDYGEPPQIAVWLEDADSKFYKTIWVTRRSGKNDWQGKVECPVSLPYWNLRRAGEEDPGFWEKVVDAISGATVAEGKIKRSIRVPKNKKWKSFIEVNVSGDYNKYFQYWSDNDIPDTEGNGQPSIIYTAEIGTDTLSVVLPKLTGRTNQLAADDSLYTDIEKITTARKLVKEIKVTLR